MLTGSRTATTAEAAARQTREPGWWRSAVVYQIYPRSFADSDGDGIGDLRGIRSRLGHLERLGVDVIWLSPVYPSPGADNGYDISDYRAVDPALGTLADFDELLAAVHRHGMALVMDLVVNHTSDEHPWFIESRSSADNPKRDWYWWRPPRPGILAGAPGAEPTNWESFFSGPTWTFDPTTGEYYLHLFGAKQPDLNWENPDVRSEVHDIMRWWLDRGVDGFRMDVINLISKDPALPDGATRSCGGLGDGFPHYANRPRVHELLHEMHREVLAPHGSTLLTIGEMPGVTVEDAVRFTDPAHREIDMVFQFEHVSLDHGPGGKFDPKPQDLRRLKASLGRWQVGLADRGWNSLYWNNHDQPRVVSRLGDPGRWWRESATALATVLHLHRGTPFVYQGEEIGMTNAPFASVDELRDVESINYYRAAVNRGVRHEEVWPAIIAMSRDNARTPMQWSAAEQAGFTAGTPWIAVNPNHAWLSADAQYEDEHSVFNHYRRLIALRHRLQVVVEGTFTMLAPDDPDIYAYVRAHGEDVLRVVANLSGAERRLSAEMRTGALELSNYPNRAVAAILRPWEAHVYISRRLSLD